MGFLITFDPPKTWAEAEKRRAERREYEEAETRRRKATTLNGYEKIMGLAGQGAKPAPVKVR
jgi:hypothetical protein